MQIPPVRHNSQPADIARPADQAGAEGNGGCGPVALAALERAGDALNGAGRGGDRTPINAIIADGSRDIPD